MSVEKQPKIVQMVSVTSDIFVLDDGGNLFQRTKNRKFMGGPASDQPEFIWIKVQGPHGPN